MNNKFDFLSELVELVCIWAVVTAPLAALLGPLIIANVYGMTR